MSTRRRLSETSVKVLGLIADGHSYAQIVDSHPDLRYHDIFHAAEEALRLNESQGDYKARMAEIRRRHPRAYEPWTPEEVAELAALRQRGMQISEIAKHLQRQPSAIRSRLLRAAAEPGDDVP